MSISLSLKSAEQLLAVIETVTGAGDVGMTTKSLLADRATVLKEEIERAKAVQAATDRVVEVLKQYPEFAVQEYLSEQVLDLASGNASDINNNSMDSQVYYLLAESPVLSLERNEADLLAQIKQELVVDWSKKPPNQA